MNTRPFRFSLWFYAFVLFAVGAAAQDMGQLRERMAERLPAIDRLKAEGAIGETNEGLLAPRGSANAEAARLIAAENADRKTVYTSIAERTSTDPATVGKARARQIAANSAPGVWLQRENGEWYRK